MKRFIYSVIAALTLGTTFVACGDDNDDPSINFSTTAEQGSAGTYSGTWYRTGEDGTEEFSGTITLAAAGTNKTTITFSCPGAEINAQSVANVWHANYSYKLFNQTSGDANGLGTSFSGIIDESGNLDLSFTISQKVGRKSVEFIYEFKGKK